MKSTQETQTIQSIEKQNPNAWLLIEVIKKNQYNQPTVGRLLEKGRRRDPLISKLSKYEVPTYISYTGERDFSNTTLLI